MKVTNYVNYIGNHYFPHPRLTIRANKYEIINLL